MISNSFIVHQSGYKMFTAVEVCVQIKFFMHISAYIIYPLLAQGIFERSILKQVSIVWGNIHIYTCVCMCICMYICLYDFESLFLFLVF